MLLSTKHHDSTVPGVPPLDIQPIGMTGASVGLLPPSSTTIKGSLSGLAARAQVGDSEALQGLTEQAARLIWSTLWRWFRDVPWEIKQDIAQTAQLKFATYIHRQRLKAKHDGAVVLLLQRITHSVACDCLKQYRKYQPLPDQIPAERETEAAAAAHQRLCLRLALRRLTETEMEIVVLKVNGMTFRQIAERLAMKMHEVTKRYYNAVEKMKAFLTELGF